LISYDLHLPNNGVFAYTRIMSETAFHPEDKARSLIDRRLLASGWLVQSRADMNLGAGLVGVAVREFQTASGPVDYGIFVGRRLCGVIEAKAEGTTLSGFSEQAARYIADVPKHLVREDGQVRFEYVASATEIHHTDIRKLTYGRRMSTRSPFMNAKEGNGSD
jgi:type I restriction enzyme R subunit